MKRKAAVTGILSIMFIMFAAVPSWCQTEVKLGLLKLNSMAACFIGIDKGFFKAEGLDIKPIWFKSAQPIAVATASGDLDVGAAGTTAGLWNSIGGGMNIRVVAGRAWEWPGYKLVGLLADTEKWQEGMKSLKDLKGKRVGITQFGSTFHYMLGNIVEKQGMSLEDFKVVALGGVRTMRDTVISHQIDSAFLVEPFITPLVQEKQAEVMLWVGEHMRYLIGVVIYGDKFMKNRKAAVAFMKGYVKSCQYYHDNALMKKNKQAYDEILTIMAKYTDKKPSQIAISLPYNVPQGEIDPAEIQKQLDWWYTHGLVEKKLSSSDVIDTTFLKEALK